MLAPKYQRYADRLQTLIDEGQSVALLEKDSGYGAYIQGKDKAALHAWIIKVQNIISTVFGSSSDHYRHLQTLLKEDVDRSYNLYPVIGVLAGGLEDLKGGFLSNQEILIAGEIFDTVIQQASFLLKAGFKDPAAILGRVVLEDALRRIARDEGLDSIGKASRINDELKAAGRYAQPRWRLIQSWLDIGNAAAHGKFAEFGAEDVSNMLSGVEQFLAGEFAR